MGRTSDAPVRPKLNHARHGQGTLDSPFRPLQIDFYFVWVYVPFQYRRSFVDTTDSVLAGDEAPCVYNLEVALPEAVRMLPLSTVEVALLAEVSGVGYSIRPASIGDGWFCVSYLDASLAEESFDEH